MPEGCPGRSSELLEVGAALRRPGVCVSSLRVILYLCVSSLRRGHAIFVSSYICACHPIFVRVILVFLKRQGRDPMLRPHHPLVPLCIAPLVKRHRPEGK